MVYQLDDELWFPDPHLGEDDGLIAVGGDLSVDRLLLAYSHGFFPWYSYRHRDEPLWYCPLQRFVIFPAEIHVSNSSKNNSTPLPSIKISMASYEAVPLPKTATARTGRGLGRTSSERIPNSIGRALPPASRYGHRPAIRRIAGSLAASMV